MNLIELLKNNKKVPKIFKGITYYSLGIDYTTEFTGKHFFTKIIKTRSFELFGRDIKIIKKALILNKHKKDYFTDEIIQFLKDKNIEIKNVYYNDRFEEINEEEYLKEERNPTGIFYINEEAGKSELSNFKDVQAHFYNKYFVLKSAFKNNMLLGDVKEVIDLVLEGAVEFICYNSTEPNIILIENEKESYYVARTKYGLCDCKIGNVSIFGSIGHNPKSIYDDLLTKEYGWLNKQLTFLDAEIIEFKKGDTTYRIHYNPNDANDKDNKTYPDDLYKLTYNDTIILHKIGCIFGNKMNIPSEEFFQKSRGSYKIKDLDDSLWRAKEILDDLHK